MWRILYFENEVNSENIAQDLVEFGIEITCAHGGVRAPLGISSNPTVPRTQLIAALTRG
jgi:hypothetical protein